MRGRDPDPDRRASPHKSGSAGQVINDKSPVRGKALDGALTIKLLADAVG